MADKLRLAPAIEQYLLWRKANGKAKNTIKNDHEVLRGLLSTSGDLYLSSLGQGHVDTHLIGRAASRGANAMAIDFTVLNGFFRWAVRNRQIGRFDNPMEGRSAPKHQSTERNRVPMKDFGRLLDAAEAHHIRDRMVIALGLHLFLRGSEIATIKIGDLRLDDGEIRVSMWKTRDSDIMPISRELDTELRRWLTHYGSEQGPLDADWYLVPAKRRHVAVYDRDLGRLVGVPTSTGRLNPTHPIVKIEEIPQRALAGIGFTMRDRDGKSAREGVHTLRRSGARARFDTLEALGYDGAIRHVQTMLHHSTMAMTEHYLGLTLDRVKRNELVRGQRMFGTDENVVELAPRQTLAVEA